MTIPYVPSLLLIVGLSVAIIYLIMRRVRAHRLELTKDRIVGVVAAYFTETNVAVRAEAIALPVEGHFILIADTEPIKRFRYSHIVEMVLIEKVKQATGQTVDSVYWRFPLPVHDEEAVKTPKNIMIPPWHAPMVDAYLEYGLKLLRAPEGMEVHKDTWAHFQEVVHEREEARTDESR